MTPPTPRAGATVPAGGSPGALPCQPAGRARASACQPRGGRRAARGPGAAGEAPGLRQRPGAASAAARCRPGPGSDRAGDRGRGYGVCAAACRPPPGLRRGCRPTAGARCRGSPPGLEGARQRRIRASRPPTADRPPGARGTRPGGPRPGASAATSTATARDPAPAVRPLPARCQAPARCLPAAGPRHAAEAPAKPPARPTAGASSTDRPTPGPWLSGHEIAICGDFCHRADAGAAISGGCQRAARQISGG
jgi:hypothetical protein